jgi:hypothetical protein
MKFYACQCGDEQNHDGHVITTSVLLHFLPHDQGSTYRNRPPNKSTKNASKAYGKLC